MSRRALPADFTAEAAAVTVARDRAEKDPQGYRTALRAFAAATGSPVRLPGGAWLTARRARAETRGAAQLTPDE